MGIRDKRKPAATRLSHTADHSSTLASNYFQVWEQAGLRIKAWDLPGYGQKATQGPGYSWSQDDTKNHKLCVLTALSLSV